MSLSLLSLQTPPTQQPKPSTGLDFSQGIIIEGELKKKRANLVVRWRKKYFVLSRNYGAMFFWTGGKNSVEGVIKKVRFDTFLSLKQLEKYGGKRVDLRVITGRRMKLLANSPEEVGGRVRTVIECLCFAVFQLVRTRGRARVCGCPLLWRLFAVVTGFFFALLQAKRWIDTIKAHLGHLMGAVRIQCAYRAYRARKVLKRLIAERAAAVKTVCGLFASPLVAVLVGTVVHSVDWRLVLTTSHSVRTGHCQLNVGGAEGDRGRRSY